MRRLLAILFTAALVAAAFTVTAQDNNLITNGGMEEGEFGPYQGKGRGNLNVPVGWEIWLGQDGAEGQYYDRGDKVYAFPHNGPDPDPYAGAASANMDGGYVQFRAAFYQTVGGTQDGQNLRAEAASWVRACNLGDAEKCGSSVESGAQTRIGIDPNGGSNPMAGEIVWSEWIEPHDRWETQAVEATATGGQVTVFLYYTQGSPADINRAYWDAVSLTSGGGGGSAGEAGRSSSADANADSIRGLRGPATGRRGRLDYAHRHAGRHDGQHRLCVWHDAHPPARTQPGPAKRPLATDWAANSGARSAGADARADRRTDGPGTGRSRSARR